MNSNLPDEWNAFFNKSRSNKFLTLKDGESIEGVFKGAPYEFYQIYEDETKEEFSKQVDGSYFKFKVNFLIKEGESYAPRILTGGYSLFSPMKEAAMENGLNAIYKIKRAGKKEFFVTWKAFLTPEQESKIDKVILFPLTKNSQQSSSSKTEKDPF